VATPFRAAKVEFFFMRATDCAIFSGFALNLVCLLLN
jgi:hypothetical protein